MTNKPTHEELEKQVKALRNEALVLREENKTIQEQLNLSKIILSATPDLLALKDRDFVYQAVNPAFCKFLGKTEESIIGKTDFDLFPRFEAEIYRRDDLKVIKTGNAQIQNEEVTGGEEKRWLRVAKIPVLSEKEKTIGVLCSVVDITNRKRAGEALRESEERFKELANLLPQPVWETDLKGNFTYSNRAGYENFSYTPKDLEEGVSVADVIAPEDRKRIVVNFGKRLRGIEFENHEYTCLTKDGRKFPALIYSSTIIKDGEPSGVRGVTLDITKRKKGELALIKKGKELEKKTHELKEVNAALKVLLKHRDKDQQDFEEKIVANVKKLVLPYVEKLKISRLNDRQIVYLNIIKSNLEDIITPFLHQLSSKYSDLTPSEIQVAEFVKEGKTTKEIAELLNSSTGSIDFHRNNLRKKLGLRNTKTNLRSFLLTLT
jgi:PAS domain S-box-containing protein